MVHDVCAMLVALQWLYILFSAAHSTINWMSATQAATGRFSWRINRFIVYICVRVIAHQIIILVSFRLVATERTSNTIVLLIRHDRKVPKLFPAISLERTVQNRIESPISCIHLPLVVMTISINVAHITIFVFRKPRVHHLLDGIFRFFIVAGISSSRDILASIWERNCNL